MVSKGKKRKLFGLTLVMLVMLVAANDPCLEEAGLQETASRHAREG
jgi:hypothetical protein